MQRNVLLTELVNKKSVYEELIAFLWYFNDSIVISYKIENCWKEYKEDNAIENINFYDSISLLYNQRKLGIGY